MRAGLCLVQQVRSSRSTSSWLCLAAVQARCGTIRREAVLRGRDMWCLVETCGAQWRRVGLGADLKTL